VLHLKKKSTEYVTGDYWLLSEIYLLICLRKISILSALAKYWNATICFVMSVRLSIRHSVCHNGATRLPLDISSRNFMFENFFRKSVERIQVLLKSEKHNGYLTWRPIYIFIISRSFLLRMKNISDSNCTENQNIHFMLNNFF
jgi:hypothetical protein